MENDRMTLHIARDSFLCYYMNVFCGLGQAYLGVIFCFV